MSFTLHQVALSYPNNQSALTRITLEAIRGEKIAIIGASGAGKTSLLRIIAAAQRPTRGGVTVLNESPWALSASALRRLRSRIGMIRQTPPMPPRQRVVTAVLAGRLGRWPWWRSLLSLFYPSDIAGVCNQLARLDLADRVFERCDRLSGGQLQRVGVARILYQQPTLMLADEPVSAMDPVLADDTINELIAEANERHITLIASLHAVDLALRWFPRIVGIKAGEVLFDLPPVRVTDALLRELYSAEGGNLPTQNNAPLVLPTPGLKQSKPSHL